MQNDSDVWCRRAPPRVCGGARVRALVHRDLHRPLQQYAHLNEDVTALGSVREGDLPDEVAHAVHTRYPHVRADLKFPLEEFKSLVNEPAEPAESAEPAEPAGEICADV